MNMNRIMKFWVLFLSIMFTSLSMQAQNVTIKATNGSTIAAVKNGGTTDTFFNLGGFATWQHEQLSMVLTVSDGTDLTANGQLDNPANNLFASGSYMQIAKGKASGANVCYATLSLPKGYRFTGYTIKFTKPQNAQNGEFNTGNNEQSTFGETNSTFATYTTQATITTNGAAQTITRTEMNEGDMSNVLYFKLQNPSNARALIQLESAEFFFTAEENYSPVTPAGEITSPVSAVDIPFSTSKVDFGPITSRTYNGTTRVSYSSASVSDLEANFMLYEAESTKSGSDIDGVSGQIIDYKAGTISSDGGYFKLGLTGQEQVYYLEAPSSIEISNGNKVPVGYRITAAEFEYNTSIGAVSTFYITYRSGNTTYYLNTEGRYTTTRVIWEMDSEGYISSNGYYLYFNNSYASTQREKPAETERFAIDSNNNIYQIQYPTYFITYYEQGWIFTTRYGMISNTSGQKATYQEISHQDPVDNYEFTVYDKTGANPTTINVTGHGTYKLSELNNDAVKFGVKGIGLIRATLTLQALDPYLDQMSVVCQDEQQAAIRMNQTFTASDFSVSGGEFYFYLPEEAHNHSVAITFEDLKSKYFDETYTGGHATNTSRINFVKSEHYNAFGMSNNKIYNDVSEAANAQKERLKVGIVGTAKFKFNNADEVGASGGTLTEYPFSLEKYATSPNNGSFSEMKFTVTTEDQVQTRYVFTTDETRYNIAPTTAIQHRAYAYYQMIVHVQTATYEPKVKFTKVYNQTLNGSSKTDAYYGVEVTATDGSGNAGYASTTKIFETIAAAISAGHDDFNNTDVPTGENGSKQIIYLDFSQLKGVYMITDEEHPTMDSFSGTNAANCLIFLPIGSSAPNNNVAYKMASGSFQAANNIVLTDKEPFYSPYDIQIDAANMAYYERKVSKDSYGKVQNATLIMPFQLTVEGGKHTNVDGSYFTLHKMQENQSIELLGDKPYAYFPNEVASVTVTNPHTPYMVRLDEVNSNNDQDYSFVVSQKGTLIKATTGANTGNGYNYYYVGETSSGNVAEGGTFEGGSYSFTSHGTYAGQAIDKTKGVFYFARNRFVNSAELASSIETVKIYPFRSYYVVGDATAPSRFATMDIIFGENENNVEDAILDLREKNMDMSLRVGHGTLTISCASDNEVRINSLSGVSHYNLNVGAGEIKTVSVPAGIYVVNGVKILVK